VAERVSIAEPIGDILGIRPGASGGEGGHVKLLNTARRAESWVIYRDVVDGAVGGHGVCEQAEWEAMERARPGGTFLVQSGIADERVAERLARASGEPVTRVWRELPV
jgi:hypothetical protein